MNRILSFVLFFLFTMAAPCFAAHSDIYKTINSYSCANYEDRMWSAEIESNMGNYLMKQPIELYVYKIIKSPEYLQRIDDFVREELPPPVYAPQNVINSFHNSSKLVVVQRVALDLKYRTATIMDERIDSADPDQTLFNVPDDTVLPGEEPVYDIDEIPEYGRIANDTVNFLESVKYLYM